MLLRTFELGPWGKERTSKIPLELMERNSYLTLEAGVNGTPIRMLIDTGGGTSVFDAGLIEELQLPRVEDTGYISGLFNTKENIEAAHIEKLQLGDFVYYGDFKFVDLSKVNAEIQKTGDEPYLGILGTDILFRWKAVINYGDLTLSVTKDYK